MLDSAYSSMGRMIGLKACEMSGYRYCDTAVLMKLLDEGLLTDGMLSNLENRLQEREMTCQQLKDDADFLRISSLFIEACQKALRQGPCLIHDRITAEIVENMGYSCLKVFTWSADLEGKIERARISPLFAMENDRRAIIRGVQAQDRLRKNWQIGLNDPDWGKLESCDLVLCTDHLGRQYSAQLLSMLM